MLTLDEMIYEMKLNGVADHVVNAITVLCSELGCKPHIVDDELCKYGYEPMFDSEAYYYDHLHDPVVFDEE